MLHAFKYLVQNYVQLLRLDFARNAFEILDSVHLGGVRGWLRLVGSFKL